MISVLQTLVNEDVAKGFWSATSYCAVDAAVPKGVPAFPSVDPVAAKLVDSASFTVSVAKFINHAVEKNSIDKVETEKRFMKLTEAVERSLIKAKDQFRQEVSNRPDSHAPRRTYPATKDLT